MLVVGCRQKTKQGLLSSPNDLIEEIRPRQNQPGSVEVGSGCRVPAGWELRDSWRGGCLGWCLKDQQVISNCKEDALPCEGDSVNKGPEEGMFGNK